MREARILARHATVRSFVAVGCILYVIGSAAVATAQTLVTLRQGQIIDVVTTADGRSGSLEDGTTVPFEILDDVMVYGAIALPAGTQGVLNVENVKKNGRFGKPGSVKYGDGVITVGDQQINVKLVGPALQKGKSKFTKGLLYLVVGVLFVKGEQGGFAAGDTLKIEVAETAQIRATR
jgi:hypothetical protein